MMNIKFQGKDQPKQSIDLDTNTTNRLTTKTQRSSSLTAIKSTMIKNMLKKNHSQQLQIYVSFACSNPNNHRKNAIFQSHQSPHQHYKTSHYFQLNHFIKTKFINLINPSPMTHNAIHQ